VAQQSRAALEELTGCAKRILSQNARDAHDDPAA
jgi:hypothetical protein